MYVQGIFFLVSGENGRKRVREYVEKQVSFPREISGLRMGISAVSSSTIRAERRRTRSSIARTRASKSRVGSTVTFLLL